MRLLDLGFFRIGSEDYAERNESYGLTTMLKRHVSIADEEKAASVDVLRRYANLGFSLVATDGTHRILTENGIPSERINKISDGSPHVLDAITSRSGHSAPCSRSCRGTTRSGKCCALRRRR